MRIGLMYTDRCNFQCKHCMVDSKKKNYITASDDVVNRFLEIVAYNKAEEICIVGGEPLLFIDQIEDIVRRVRTYCDKVLIYSNGTFLLNKDIRERVADLKVKVRISKTDFHKDFWNDDLEELINKSDYWKIELLGKDMRIFPRGRALTNQIYTNSNCPCSLVTGKYEGYYHSNRFLIMPDGSVNIWCPCMSLELANVFQDSIITHDLLRERECKLREYLQGVNMFFDSMEFMCNKVCYSFKVSKHGIYRDNELMKEF